LPRALCLIRAALHYRRDAFCRGLQAAGYRLVNSLPDPKQGDVLVIWNRYGHLHAEANRFERCGARAVIAENGYFGKSWRNGTWYALAVGHHAGAGKWRVGGPERWDSWGVDLKPWRQGKEPLILGQRGIGEPGIASPARWAEQTQKRIGGRIRAHPGNGAPQTPLLADLATASAVVTWASSAALIALAEGVPVFHEMPRWIGAHGSQPIASYPVAKCDDEERLNMFRRLAWAQWEVAEIESGAAFTHLLQ
jgi:hypothetical protein